ncbi:C6 zinc finger domain containing protein [Seiridium cupressi]
MSSHHIPEVLMRKVDEYVDSLAPQIQPRIASELETFQQLTIDSMEDQVVNAFRALFNKDSSGQGSRGLSDSPPDAYGRQSLPFANEISQLTRNFNQITDEAGDDLRDIFSLTEGGDTQSRGLGGNNSGNDGFSGAKGFLSNAINVVQDHLDKNSGGGGQRFELDGLLGVISNTVKDAAQNPEEKARAITPEIKDQVGAKLREQHGPIAEQFTRIALDHIKEWLRGHTSTRDASDGAKAEIESLVKGIGGLFGSKKHSDEGASRGLGDGDGAADGGSGGGFSKVISDKLTTGLGRVHREVRLEFRNVLGGIEKELFELLPDQFQRPLEKILGGNPFDSQLERDARSTADRGFGDDIKLKLVTKIRGLIRKLQETLRESILGAVNGGHRKLERQSWLFVQNMVEQKVQKYLPKLKIAVPDDIGNEGVSVGTPAQNLGGVHPAVPLPPPGQYDGQYSQPSYTANPQYTTEQHSGQYSQPSYNTNTQYSPEQHGGQYSQPSYPPPPQHLSEHHAGQYSHHNQDPSPQYQQHQNYPTNNYPQ